LPGRRLDWLRHAARPPNRLRIQPWERIAVLLRKCLKTSITVPGPRTGRAVPSRGVPPPVAASSEHASTDWFKKQKSEPGCIAEQDGPIQRASKRMGGRLSFLSNLHSTCRWAVACAQQTGLAVDAGGPAPRSDCFVPGIPKNASCVNRAVSAVTMSLTEG